jgi:hypothetical protein
VAKLPGQTRIKERHRFLRGPAALLRQAVSLPQVPFLRLCENYRFMDGVANTMRSPSGSHVLSVQNLKEDSEHVENESPI